MTIDAGERWIGGPYEVLWSRTPIVEDSDAYVVLDKGEYPKETTKVSVSFTIPEAAYGQNFVQYRRAWRPEDPYSFTFSVLPDIKVNPSSVPPNTEVTVKGMGFPADNKDIKLSFDGKDTKLEITANDIGTFTAKFTIPITIAGKHKFQSTVEGIHIEESSANLEVRPKVLLEPKLPEVGKEVTLSGCGFAAKSPISIKYDDIDITDSPATDELGTFSHKFNVPDSSKDNHIITATDKVGNLATYGLPLEGQAPPKPTTLSPGEKDNQFGWFGAQPVTFRWTEVSDPSGVTYTLEIDDNLNFFPLEPGMRKTGLTTTTCTLQIEPGTYYWRVIASDGAGNQSEPALSPYPFKVGSFSVWYLIVGGLVLLLIFIFAVRAFYRRISEYMK